MSRRNTSTLSQHPVVRIVGLGSVLLLAFALALPAMASAQDELQARDIEWEWQLLKYRDANGDVVPVPAGVGATLSLFAGLAFGEAAGSTFETNYTVSQQTIFIDPPAVERFDCDPSAQAFDEAFYANIDQAASFTGADSILVLQDAIGDPIMTLTRAVIEDDPTVARWDLARIADADGSVDPVIQGLDPWVEFLRGGRLVGNTGCGAFLGSYVVNDGTVRISDLAYRLESCSEQARAQAARIIDTLGEITDFKVLPAGLALQDDLGTTRLALIPDVDLGRRTWTPVAIYDVDGEIAWGESELNTSAVKFTGTAAEGRTICRAFKAESLRSGLAVNVSDIRLANKGACPVSRAKNPTPLQDIEDDFLGALREAASHALRGDELELKGVSGATLMRLRPQADLVGPTWVLDWMDVSPKSGKSTIRRPIEGTTITASFEDIEVVLGETGAVDRNEVNVYTADYRTPAATRLQIGKPTPQGRACAGNKAKSKKCKQQREYLKTLPATDSYIVLDDSLRLLRGTRAIMRFVPESLGAEPESDS